MKSIHIIISTYQQYLQLKLFHLCLILQTNQNFYSYYINDGFDDNFLTLMSKLNLDRETNFYCTSNRTNDWGHSGRSFGLNNLKNIKDTDYVLFTNADNYYVPVFIEELNRIIQISNPGVIYFDMIHSHNRSDSSSGGTYGFLSTAFMHSFCDMGSFIVRYDIAKNVGFNSRGYAADGDFIKEILDYKEKVDFPILKINKVLLVHN